MKLEKKLTTFNIFSIVTGVMISSGIFVLPGIVFSKTGPAVIISYLLAGLFYIPAIVSIVELSSAMPRAGGAYFVIDRSLGAAAGTVGGTSSWFSLSLKSAFALIGIGALAQLIFPEMPDFYIKLVAIGFGVFFTILNLFSVKLAGNFQSGLVVGLIGILCYYIFQGSGSVDPMNFQNFAPGGMLPVVAGAGMVFVSFAGVIKATSLAEETIDAGKTIPRGIFLAFGSVMILYMLVLFVTVGVLPAPQLANTLTPLSDTALKTAGKTGAFLISLAAFFAFATTANAGVMAASRDLMAMSADGHFPAVFKKVSDKFNTPINSILLTTGFMITLILTLDLEMLVKTASGMQIIMMIMIILSVIAMREGKIYSYRPTFKSFLYPYLHIAGIIGLIILLFDMGLKSAALTLSFLIGGLLWFWVYTRIQVPRRKSALVHLVERFMPDSRISPEKQLPAELGKILWERDQIKEDDFDLLVEAGSVLDLRWRMSVTSFFAKSSRVLQKKISLDSSKIYDMLMDSEAAGTSVIRPGLAISWILNEKIEKPHLLAARCIHGIKYSPINPPVYAAFVYVGPPHTRFLLMQAIFALAQLFQSKQFDREWIEARDELELRELLRVGDRRRIYEVYCKFELDELKGEIDEIEKRETICKRVGEQILINGKILEIEDFYSLPLLEGFDREHFIAGCTLVPIVEEELTATESEEKKILDEKNRERKDER